jgi:hypothetical protein
MHVSDRRVEFQLNFPTLTNRRLVIKVFINGHRLRTGRATQIVIMATESSATSGDRRLDSHNIKLVVCAC